VTSDILNLVSIPMVFTIKNQRCLDGCGGGDPKESLSGLGGQVAPRGLWPGDEAQEGHGDFHRTTDCWHVLWQTAGSFG